MTDLQQMFFVRLDELGTGERAALRREAGSLLNQSDGKAISVFYQCLPRGIAAWQEDRWFAVACLRCLWDAGSGNGTPLEQVISGLLRSDELSDSTEHRVELLLDTKWDADGYMLIKLTRLVKLIRQKSERMPIDFAELLDDLLGWNSETQYVQRKWAKAIFMRETTMMEKEN